VLELLSVEVYVKQREWKIRRVPIEIKDAQFRWDQAYQCLLSKTKQNLPEPVIASQCLPANEVKVSQLQEVVK
jgi:hypothetical protein